jgi:hypothetical protein
MTRCGRRGRAENGAVSNRMDGIFPGSIVPGALPRADLFGPFGANRCVATVSQNLIGGTLICVSERLVSKRLVDQHAVELRIACPEGAQTYQPRATPWEKGF